MPNLLTDIVRIPHIQVLISWLAPATSLKIVIGFSISCSHIVLTQDLKLLVLVKNIDDILSVLKETGGNYEKLGFKPPGHRGSSITEYPELEGPHKGHQSPTPASS